MRRGVSVLVIALLIALVWVSGCQNLSLGSTQLADFGGNSANATEMQNCFLKKYGDPATYSGPPRFLEPMVSDRIADNLPADTVTAFSNRTRAVYAWAFYEGFKPGDAVAATWTFNGMQYGQLSKQVAGNYGIVHGRFDMPNSGWALGTHTITLSGNGVQGAATFDIIDGPTRTGQMPCQEGAMPVTTPPRTHVQTTTPTPATTSPTLGARTTLSYEANPTDVPGTPGPTKLPKPIPSLYLTATVNPSTGFFGDNFNLRGTSTYGDSPPFYIFLFVENASEGGSLPANGVRPDNFAVPSVSGDDSTFAKVPVTGQIWNYIWNTSHIAGGSVLPDSNYRFWIVNKPLNRHDLPSATEASDAGYTKVEVHIMPGPTPCTGGYSSCGTKCVNLKTDTSNCGSCGRVCPAASTCSSGKCCSTVPQGGNPPTFKTVCV